MEDAKGVSDRMPAQLLERLAARQAKRKAGGGSAASSEPLLPPLDLRSDEGEEVIPPTAGLNTPTFFLEHMSRASALIARRIDRLRADCESGHLAPEERTPRLDDLWDQIEAVQRWFSASSPHLKPFHVEQAHQEVEEMKRHFHETRAAILPKKKFRFGAKTAPNTTKAPSTPTSTSSHSTVKKPPPQPEEKALFSLPQFTLANMSCRRDLCLPSAETDDGSGEALRDQSLCLTNLTDCEVHITSRCGNLMASNLIGCVVRCSQPISSSVLLQDCSGCRFVLAARQLRVHRTWETRFDVFVASAPIIEDSGELLVGPWEGSAAVKGVLGEKNHWAEVQDFSCPTLVVEKAVESPNWSLLPKEEWICEVEKAE